MRQTEQCHSLPAGARPVPRVHYRRTIMAERARTPVRNPAPPSPWRHYLSAGSLFLMGLLVAVSVFSNSPADPPHPAILPANIQPVNLLGYPGAALAHSLLSAIGLGTYVLLGCWL